MTTQIPLSSAFALGTPIEPAAYAAAMKRMDFQNEVAKWMRDWACCQPATNQPSLQGLSDEHWR